MLIRLIKIIFFDNVLEKCLWIIIEWLPSSSIGGAPQISQTTYSCFPLYPQHVSYINNDNKVLLFNLEINLIQQLIRYNN